MFMIVENARFRTAPHSKTMAREFLAYALDIRNFQKHTQLHHCDISDLRRRVEECKYLPGDSKSTGALSVEMIKWFAKQSLRRFCVSFLDF